MITASFIPAWHVDGACRGLDPEDFHPPASDGESIQAAKAICSGCVMQPRCLQWILQVEQDVGSKRPVRDGIYGCTTPQERRRLCKGTHRQCTECLRVLPKTSDVCCPQPMRMADADDGTRTAA